MDIKDFILETNVQEDTKNPKKVQSETTYSVELASGADWILSKKTGKKESLLVCLISQNQIYIKQGEKITPATDATFSNFFNVGDVLSFPEIWVKNLQRNKKMANLFLNYIQGDMVQYMLKRNMLTYDFTGADFSGYIFRGNNADLLWRESGSLGYINGRQYVDGTCAGQFSVNLRVIDAIFDAVTNASGRDTAVAAASKILCKAAESGQNFEYAPLNGRKYEYTWYRTDYSLESNVDRACMLFSSMKMLEQFSKSFSLEHLRKYLKTWLDIPSPFCALPTDLVSFDTYFGNQDDADIKFDPDAWIEYATYGAQSQGFVDYTFFNEWKDTLNMQVKLSGKVVDKYPDALESYHKKLVTQMNIRQIKIDAASFSAHAADLKPFNYKTGEFFFMSPDSVQDIRDEAVQQHNCLASYVSSYARGQSQLFFMRKNKTPKSSYISIELRENGTPVQIKGKCNSNVTDLKALEAIDKFLAFVQKQIESGLSMTETCSKITVDAA